MVNATWARQYALLVIAVILTALPAAASYSCIAPQHRGSHLSLPTCLATTAPNCLTVFDFDAQGNSDGAININDFDGFALRLRGPDTPPGGGCPVIDQGAKRNDDLPPTGTFALHGRPIDVLSDGHVLLYVRARYYDPRHGRWLQRDPSGYADGANLYESFRGNATRFTDPHGTDVWVTADPREVTDATGREWWEITYTRHRNKLDVGYVFTFYQWWWGDWGNENFSVTETIVEYFPRRQGVNIWNMIASEQERLVDEFTASADAQAYREAIIVAASAPIQIATAGAAETVVASGAARIGVTSSTALGRVAISSATNALVTGAGEAGGTAVLVPFGEATLTEVGEAGLRGIAIGGVTGGAGRVVFEASPTLQRLIPDALPARARGATSEPGVSEARYLEYRALRLQGLKASEAHQTMKLFDTGVSGEYAFHFTTIRGARGIIASQRVMPSSPLALGGAGVYVGTTPTPSFMIKHMPIIGWGLGRTPVRLPIKLTPSVVDQAIVPSVPLLKTRLIRVNDSLTLGQ